MKIQKIRDVKTPTRGTSGSAGIDFYIPEGFNLGEPLYLQPGEAVNIPSGILIQMPKDHVLIAFNKSGVSVKQRLQVGACIIDSDYTGEMHLHIFNTDNKVVTILPGQKIMQFLLLPVVLEPVEVVEQLQFDFSERGAGGFGSTGLT